MLRQIQPRNARSKRALERRAPKAQESPKTALFLRGTTCSQIVQDAMSDLYSMRVPLAKKFTKKNAVRPFEDPSSLEFFSDKNDTSLLVFGSSSKKRPHCLTLVRTFDHKILDMLELYIDAETFRTIGQFKTQKFAVGQRPILLFAGTSFESPVTNEYTVAKSLLTDLFRGDSTADKIDVEGLSYLVSISAEEGTGNESDGSRPAIHLRTYRLRTKKSGQKLPRVEVDEIGPRMDLRLGRLKEADAEMMKEAMRKAKTTEERTKKNVSTDAMGDKIGRIHLGKQDLNELQTRKMKGLKRGREEGEPAGGGDGLDDEPKKARKL